MTKQELETIRNIIDRLQKPHLGCALHKEEEEAARLLAPGADVVSRIYIDTWLIGPLLHLLPEARDPGLAVRMSRR